MRLESANDVVGKAPRTRIIGLRLIEDDDALFEIEIAPLKARCLAVAHALATEDAVEDASFTRNIRARHQRLVFLRIKERLRSRRTELRQEAVWQRIGGDDLARV